MGYLEKVYENALFYELIKAGFIVEQQKPIQVVYDGVVVGDFVADLVVKGLIIIELKATNSLTPVFNAICLNYLKATGLPLCLLLNFGTSALQIKRLVGETYEKLGPL